MLRSRDIGLTQRELAIEPQGSVRGALRALIGRISRDSDLGHAAGAAEAAVAPALATRTENRRLLLRANARAAFDSVEGSTAAALETAIDVMEEAWAAACAERDAHAEALKAIRMYADDAKLREIAGTSLTPCARGSRQRPPASAVATADRSYDA